MLASFGANEPLTGLAHRLGLGTALAARRRQRLAGLEPVLDALRVAQPRVLAERVEQHDHHRPARDRRQHDHAAAGLADVAGLLQLDVPRAVLHERVGVVEAERLAAWAALRRSARAWSCIRGSADIRAAALHQLREIVRRRHVARRQSGRILVVRVRHAERRGLGVHRGDERGACRRDSGARATTPRGSPTTSAPAAAFRRATAWRPCAAASGCPSGSRSRPCRRRSARRAAGWRRGRPWPSSAWSATRWASLRLPLWRRPTARPAASRTRTLADASCSLAGSRTARQPTARAGRPITQAKTRVNERIIRSDLNDHERALSHARRRCVNSP